MTIMQRCLHLATPAWNNFATKAHLSRGIVHKFAAFAKYNVATCKHDWMLLNLAMFRSMNVSHTAIDKC
jgi:hypothetical protein